MKIIISPAKQMTTEADVVAATAAPVMTDRAHEVLDYLRSLSFAEAKKLWGCSEALAEKSFQQLHDISLTRLENATPAILAYDGIAFKYMAPSVFEDGQFDYVQDHLLILSALFGAVRPLDGVVPYRLEMQAKAAVSGTKNLYDFWGRSIYDAACDGSHVIVNLASKEYSKCVERYLQPEDRFITCVFSELEGAGADNGSSVASGKVVQKGVYAKMARGDMVRFMAENAIEDPRDMKAYNRLGYSFCPELSNNQTYVFLK